MLKQKDTMARVFKKQKDAIIMLRKQVDRLEKDVIRFKIEAKNNKIKAYCNVCSLRIDIENLDDLDQNSKSVF